MRLRANARHHAPLGAWAAVSQRRIQMKNSLTTPPAKDPRELWKHFSDTYFSLRLGLAVLAFAFPFVLYGLGKFLGLDLQPSMSAYFWAATAEQCASFPMRTIFVGFLVAIGAGLYLYKPRRSSCQCPQSAGSPRLRHLRPTKSAEQPPATPSPKPSCVRSWPRSGCRAPLAKETASCQPRRRRRRLPCLCPISYSWRCSRSRP